MMLLLTRPFSNDETTSELLPLGLELNRTWSEGYIVYTQEATLVGFEILRLLADRNVQRRRSLGSSLSMQV